MAIETLKQKLINHIKRIYPERNHERLADEIISTFWPTSGGKKAKESHLPGKGAWSEQTTLLITYGDTIKKAGQEPLKTLHTFLKEELDGAISGVHILPFFPYSSDDGFSVMDYHAVREDLGDWEDIKAIGADFRLMSDIVINHASAKGNWFDGFLKGEEPYKDYFFTANTDDDISRVIRPRPSPLLTEYQTADGPKHLWCTFGPDQVDLDFTNPDVLLAFIDIMRVYLNNNIRIFRLDAVAFLWKEIGSECIHLPQTHEIIRLFRTLIDYYEEDVLIITETNVPNHENLTYFGNQNEAHLIYNFSLPPLLIQALLTGNEYYLKKWLMELPPTQQGCAYLNFVAGHDGIGLRPAAGILMDEDFEEMIETVRNFGGEISMRTGEDGTEKPYEMNISLYDALKGTINGEDNFQSERFIASQTIMLGLEGVPAFYIHSLLATPNDHEKYKRTGSKRGINRHQYNYDDLYAALNDPKSEKSYIFNEIKRIITIRTQQPAFHPNAIQFTLQLPEGFFGFWRQSEDRKQHLFCITNITNKDREIALHHLNLYSGVKWKDLLTDQVFENRENDLIIAPYQSMWITNIAK
ncbi:MAG: sugar phosphorylase [Alphaproteobacteria bacterium]|nr:sugar phosphorylase [Alphaproteobacteria bacterium]